MTLTVTALADDTSAPRIDSGVRPLLKQLNVEVQSLYYEVQAGMARVQLPAPRWAGAPVAEQDHPLQKWQGKLDPAVQRRLEEERKDAQAGKTIRFTATVGKAPATTQPTTQPQAQSQSGTWTMSSGADDVIVFRPGAGGGALRFDTGGSIDRQGNIAAGNGRVDVDVVAAGNFAPNNIGLVLDDKGHVLVPICVEKDAIGDGEVPIMIGQGQMAGAKFVASDRQTNITILKLTKPAGMPIRMAPGRPAEGTLVMFLSPNTGSARLMVWTNELRDWGVVIAMDGSVYGFARQGQFLSASGCKPVIQALVAAKPVKRAKLGVAIAEISQSDALRQTMPELATHPAVRITEIAPNSVAARNGLRVGDVVLTLNEQVVGDPSSFAAAISGSADRASLQIMRGGRNRTLTIEFHDR